MKKFQKNPVSNHKKFQMLRKAQSSLEFVLLVSFVLLMMGVFLVIIQKNIVGVQAEKEQILVSQVARIVNSELLMAEQSGEGYKRTFFIPTTLDGLEYSLSVLEDGSGKQDMNISFDGNDYIYFFTSDSAYIDNPEDLGIGTHVIERRCNPLRCFIVIDP